MNNKVDLETRLHFRDWLRDELRNLDFYQRRGDHYLIREFAKYCVSKGAPIDEASLGRYLRDVEPVLPTPERCRALARVFGYAPARVLIHAGYLEGDDLFPPLTSDLKPEEVAQVIYHRNELVAEAAAGKGPFESLGALVEQVQESNPRVAEDVVSRPDASEIRQVFEKSAKSKSPGPAAQGAQALEEFMEAQKRVQVGELTPAGAAAPAEARQPQKVGGRGRQKQRV